MFIEKIVKLLTSLKLTATLLAFSIVLVFIGTIAQADEGLYGAQAHYFNAWFVVGANFFGHHLPVLLPGGLLLGTLVLANLICAHIYRFELTWKKIGIQLAHAGVIVILVGELSAFMLSRELHMEFNEGESRNYSESASRYELAFENAGEITAIPLTLLKAGQKIELPSLPFSILVKTNWHNSTALFRAPMMKNGPALSDNGLAAKYDFSKAADVKTTDDRNIPTLILEFHTKANSLGLWAVTDPALAGRVFAYYKDLKMGGEMSERMATPLLTRQSIELNGSKFTFAIQPLRDLHSFSITLLKATHTVYPGTDIPKDFRSRVRIENAKTGENREVEISMNQPLRYGGYAFYQYQMSAGEMVERAGETPHSVLQVVRNPSWLTPYIGCGLVSLGLVVQFMFHLVKFVSKRK